MYPVTLQRKSDRERWDENTGAKEASLINESQQSHWERGGSKLNFLSYSWAHE